MKRVLIAGASGMVGSLLLECCLESTEVSEVISLNRKPSGIQNDKLVEEIITNFKSYDNNAPRFQNIDVAFFCIGVYTGTVPKKTFKEITVDFAVGFARFLKHQSPGATLCMLSGMGADRTEKSRASFARYKGMAENQIASMGLDFYTFRPGYIFPVATRQEPNFMYKLMRVFYPLLRLFGPQVSIKSTELARAMFDVGMNKSSTKKVLENVDILDVLKRSEDA